MQITFYLELYQPPTTAFLLSVADVVLSALGISLQAKYHFYRPVFGKSSLDGQERELISNYHMTP